MKLFSQFEHVDNATPFARRLDGNISEGIAHGTGPHDAPKIDMEVSATSSTSPSCTQPARIFSTLSLVTQKSIVWSIEAPGTLAKTEHVE